MCAALKVGGDVAWSVEKSLVRGEVAWSVEIEPDDDFDSFEKS